jgi:hypothetical protein
LHERKARLPKQIFLSEIDYFIPASTKDGSQRKEAETLRLLEGNRRWHGEFLPSYRDLHQRWPIMCQRFCNYGFHLIRSFGF